jgi:heat shock protein HtpX
MWTASTELFINALPFVLGGVAIWFLVAFLFNTHIINRAAHSKPLDRIENKRVYNLVENLTMASGMKMPRVNVIDSPALNAFASGINEKTYTVTLTTGIIETLSDEELEGVIAHELTHIRNRDVRVLIISIVFVGIFSLIMSGAFNAMPFIRGKNSGAIKLALLVIGLVAGIGVLFSSLTKFAISRKREYMADAGAAEMTRKPAALALALRKISGNPDIAQVERADVAQLFIHHSAKGKKRGGFLSGLFSTHPPIEQRIEILEQF